MTGSVTVSAAADALENVLVFSKTAGFRHDSIPAGIAAIQQLGQQNDFAVTATEDSAQFTDANLANFDVVVFLSTTGDVLDDAQQAAFERYIRAGGGFVGIHAAADTEYGWDFYNNMIGASFRNHPAGTPTAAVDIVDPDEPSTQGLPARWTRTDEWYNYQGPIAPAVNGSPDAADYSARLSNVHVLATVDESTYGEDDGNTADDDHPISWCSDYEGGRIWYTGMGHTIASYSEPDFLKHILGGPGDRVAQPGRRLRRRRAPGSARRRRLREGHARRRHAEPDGARRRAGRPRLLHRARRARADLEPVTQQTVTAGTIPVSQSQENGLLGLQLAPDFDTSHWVYLFYTSLPDPPGTQVDRPLQGQRQLARHGVRSSRSSRSSTRPPSAATRPARCTSTAPATSTSRPATTRTRSRPTASTPIDERPGRAFWDAQRTAANTNDLNGKIMRIKPLDNPTARPASATRTRSRPATCSPPGTANTRPEIYGMGFRNPFRFTVDPETNWVLMADYGPDAGSTNPNRGPQGSVEFNVLEKAGNYGWPYCIRQNVAVQRLRLRDRPVRAEVQLRRPGQQLAEQHRPDEPAAGHRPADDVGGLHRDRHPVPGARHRRRPDGRPALPLRPEQPVDDQVPGVLRRQVVHRRVEQRLDQDRDARRDRQRGRRRPVPVPRCGRLHARRRRQRLLQAPDGLRLRSRRLAVRDRVGLRLRRQQRRLRHLPDRLHGR